MRGSARLRLTLAFTLGALTVGTAIVLAVFLVMRFVPDYRLVASVGELDPSGAPSVGLDVGFGALAGTSGLAEELDPSEAAAAITVRGESDVLRILLVTSVIVLGVTVLACVALSWRFAGRVLRPVEALSEAAARAEHGAGDRIEVREPHDEFGRLALTLNEMFDRLDRSYAAQQRFAANASHELRTPLATTQAMLDVALAEPDEVDVARLAERLRATNARSIGTVDALLELADAQAGSIDRERVDLRDLAEDGLTRIRQQAASRGIAVDAAVERRVVEGDRALLGSMVDNLLTNAIRHNDAGGSVSVRLDALGLRVSNTGARIADADVERLTEPFFRAAGRVGGSHGIGLALVAAVADLHGAELTLSAPASGGLHVDVVFAADTLSDDHRAPAAAGVFPTTAQ